MIFDIGEKLKGVKMTQNRAKPWAIVHAFSISNGYW
jgi:hypothetical protein